MDLWKDPETFRQACAEARARGGRVGLVPTMGALHAGHVSLIAAARHRAGFVAVSVFVNPTQFGPGEDLARYPRTLDRDMAACVEAGASGVFAPEAGAMYPPGDETRVRVGATAAPLCGAHRPEHFEGVATIVTKLFALAGPCVAVFGRKDYQQIQVVKRLARDLFLPVEVLGAPTVREPDGLAMSSRNVYLSPEARRAAAAIPRALADACRAFAAGERRAGALVGVARARIEALAEALGGSTRPGTAEPHPTSPAPVSVDYIDIADPETLRVLGSDERVGERALLALAVRILGTRLIDNVVLGEEGPPVPGGGEGEGAG